MSKLCNASIVLTATLFLSAPAWAGEGPAGHRHDALYSAGEPGDPSQPARIVEVAMGEADGKMLFTPGKIEATKGEQLKFVLRNNGELEHEFVLATTADNLKHAEAMKKHPDMEHDDPNGQRLIAKQTGEIVWKFTNAGEFEYACLIPGHREAGMIGAVLVK